MAALAGAWLSSYRAVVGHPLAESRTMAQLVDVVLLLVATQHAPNQPPTIRGEIHAPPFLHWGQEVRFTLQVTDAEGDPVDVRLVSPLPDVEFLAVVRERPPVVREVRWIVPTDCMGPQELAFEAFDSAGPLHRTRWSRTVHVSAHGSAPAVAFRRLSDDEGPSLLCTASQARIRGRDDAGALYLWRLSALKDDAAVASRTGAGGGVSPASWPPSVPQSETEPFARLSRADPVRDDAFGDSQSSQPVQLFDVNADGALDVVVSAHGADTPTVIDGGVVDVFLGGPGLAGNVTPWVEFSDPNGTYGDAIGAVRGVPVLFGDLSGDGFGDLVAVSVRATVGGNQYAGRIYVFAGGPNADAKADPLARLELAAPGRYDSLGGAGTFTPSVQIADVTGDGNKDVIATAYSASSNGVTQNGGAFVWHGGTGFAGTRHPDAELSTTTADDHLGLANASLFVQDLSGDGIDDIIVVGPFVDVNGVTDAGAIAIWFGGSTITGNPSPDALLSIPSAHAQDYLGLVWYFGAAVVLRDVTGDGVSDILAIASEADEGGIVDRGAVCVWQGGASLVGAPAPLAVLTGLGSTTGEHLGHCLDGNPLRFADVTGDGILDVVVPAARAAEAGVKEAGVVHVFAGGAGMKGNVQSIARLRTQAPQPADRIAAGFPGLICADVSGDGIDDIVASAPDLSRSNSTQGGAAVWLGGPALTGVVTAHAELIDPAPLKGDRLGMNLGVADFTGDGIRDVMISSFFDGVGGVRDQGSVLVFAGGAALAGVPAPFAELAAPPPFRGKYAIRMNFDPGGPRGQIADVNGDGRPDVVAVCPLAEVDGVLETGAVFVWFGGSGIGGQPSPDLVLTGEPDAEQFGGSSHRNIHVLPRADRQEQLLFINDPFDSTPAATQAGSITTITLRPSTLERGKLFVPNAKDEDRLGGL